MYARPEPSGSRTIWRPWLASQYWGGWTRFNQPVDEVYGELWVQLRVACARGNHRLGVVRGAKGLLAQGLSQYAQLSPGAGRSGQMMRTEHADRTREGWTLARPTFKDEACNTVRSTCSAIGSLMLWALGS